MFTTQRRAAAVLGTLVIGATGSLVSAGPAQAAGWLGTCHPYRTNLTAGGWCDGNGPDWTYQGVCYSNSVYRYGPMKWAGDRNGSRAECSGPSQYGGLYYYYKGRYMGSSLA